MIKILVEFGIFTWDKFGNLNTLNWKLRYINQIIIYCYTPGIYSIVSSKDTAVLSKVCAIPQCRTSQTEKWNFQNKASGADLRISLESPSPSSNYSLTTTQWQMKRGWWWKCDVLHKVRISQIYVPGQWVSEYFFSIIPNIQILEFLVPYMKHFPNILTIRPFCSETLRKTNVSSEIFGKQLPRWQWANTSRTWKKNIEFSNGQGSRQYFFGDPWCGVMGEGGQNMEE